MTSSGGPLTACSAKNLANVRCLWSVKISTVGIVASRMGRLRLRSRRTAPRAAASASGRAKLVGWVGLRVWGMGRVWQL